MPSHPCHRASIKLRLRPKALAMVLIAATAAPGQAAEDSLATLLTRLRPSASPAAGHVVLTARVEPRPDGARDLVVRLTPQGSARLVADPGITVTPVRRRDLAWRAGAAASDAAPGRDYFDGPQEIRLPFVATAAGPVAAEVDYAYCLLHEQCRLGRSRVQVDVTTKPAG